VSDSEKSRPITPYAPFDSRPKIPAAKPTRAPVDPFEGLPSLRSPAIPRAPRLPGETAALLRQDEIQTDPAPPLLAESGEHPLPESEKTPLESPYSLKKVSEKLDAVLEASLAAANESIATRDVVRTLTEALQALARRVTALEVSGRWAPLIISSVAIVGMIWMAFQLQRMQIQIQTLMH